jgi:hypothetical protein
MFVSNLNNIGNGNVPNSTSFNSSSSNSFPHPHPQFPKVTLHLKERRSQTVKAIQRNVTAELHAIP